MRIINNGDKKIIILDDGSVINMNGNASINVNGRNISFGDSRQVMILVLGNTGSIRTTSGDITVLNKVEGNISTASGDVKANTIEGNVSTMSGDVEAKKLYGSASTMSGDIRENRYADDGFDFEATAEEIKENIKRLGFSK